MSTDATSAPSTPFAARPTSVCIIRSEPANGRRLYSITTTTDVLKPSARSQKRVADVDQALQVVARFLRETAG